jgi:hypothetical protein
VKVGETLTLIAPASSAGYMTFKNIDYARLFCAISRRVQRSKFRARVLPRVLSAEGKDNVREDIFYTSRI